MGRDPVSQIDSRVMVVEIVVVMTVEMGIGMFRCLVLLFYMKHRSPQAARRLRC